MHKNTAKTYLLILFIAFTACRTGDKGKQVIEFDTIQTEAQTGIINPLDSTGEGLPIFYNMYLSVELSSMFESAGAVFTTELLNGVDKSPEYITSSQQAVNIGVFAVDLSYARVFDQLEIAGKYFNAMKQLSQELGIPADYFENTVTRFERNFTDKDSLIALANEVYLTTDNYLKENERYTTASMIILGGWLEAIYIAINVAVESRDVNIIERLIDQKYSLNNLIIMLYEHRQNEVVAGFLRRLDTIRKDFNSINASFPADFDPNSVKGQKTITSALTQIKVLEKSVESFRNELVN
jgi:hypothetical protein